MKQIWGEKVKNFYRHRHIHSLRVCRDNFLVNGKDQLEQIFWIRLLLSVPSGAHLVQTLVIPHLDCCSRLFGLTISNLAAPPIPTHLIFHTGNRSTFVKHIPNSVIPLQILQWTSIKYRVTSQQPLWYTSSPQPGLTLCLPPEMPCYI